MSDHYLVGMLALRRGFPEPVDFDGQQDELVVEGAGDSSEATPDIGAPAGPALVPSSIGMTFGVEGGASQVGLEASWGRYERTSMTSEDGQGRPGGVAAPSGRGDAHAGVGTGTGWPFGLVPDAAQDGAVVRGQVRRMGPDWMVTVLLVNDQEAQPTYKDEAWLFQPSLAAFDPQGRASCARRRAPTLGPGPPRSQGLGLGLGLPGPGGGGGRPWHRCARRDRCGRPPGGGRRLRERDRPAGGPVPRPEEGLVEHASTAEGALVECRRAAQRIRVGIALFEPASPSYGPRAAEAFRFANPAMWLQRIHTLAADRRRGDPTVAPEDALVDADRPEQHRWRPFQLA